MSYHHKESLDDPGVLTEGEKQQNAINIGKKYT